MDVSAQVWGDTPFIHKFHDLAPSTTISELCSKVDSEIACQDDSRSQYVTDIFFGDVEITDRSRTIDSFRASTDSASITFGISVAPGKVKERRKKSMRCSTLPSLTYY